MIFTCDIGTSSLKAGLIDQAGTLRAFARLRLGAPTECAWQQAFLRAARKMPAGLRRRVRAVSLSGNAPTLVPVDRRGRTTAAPLMWNELICEPYADDRSLSFFLPKVKKFAVEHPGAYGRTHRFLPAAEYLIFRLTGGQSAFIPHREYLSYYWTDEDIALFRLDKGKFPKVQTIGSAAGILTEKAARRTGLPARTPVYCGGADFLMAILGSGAAAPGRANDRGGTSEALNYCSRESFSSGLVRPVPGFLAGSYNLGGFVPEAGRLNAWLKDRLVGRCRGFAEFQELVDEALPGSRSVNFIPPLLRGGKLVKKYSLKTLFEGMSRETAKGDFVLAFWEYLGFSLRRIVLELEAHGFQIESLHSTGGLAKSSALNQLKATITGRTIKVPEIEDSELLGNAIIAFTGLGDFSAFQEGAQSLVRFSSEFTPNTVLGALYEDLYESFLDRSRSNDFNG